MNPYRILVVEDESIVALDIGERLVSLGYELAGRAASGADAVALCGQQRPDLVLMDICLQGAMDGIAAAEQIRTRFRVPVVFLTAYAEDATLDRAKLAEPFGFILKPFEDREVKSAIEIAVYKHRAEEEIRRLSHLYATLSAVNQAVVRCRSQQTLFDSICRLVVEVGQFKAAWVGLQSHEGGPPTVAAWHGAEAGLAALPGCPSACGGMAESLRTGRTTVANQAQRDTRTAQCHDLLRQFGVGACAVLPIRRHEHVCGVLSVCSAEPDFFSDDEVRLLEAAALDLSFALDRLEDEEQRRRAEAEREDMQARLREAQKLEAVGRLAGGVAHDFNNLATAIMHNLELSRDELPPAHPVRTYLDEIAVGTRRSADLTRQLLAFARRQTIAPVVFDLNARVAGMLTLLRRLIGEDIDLVWSPDTDLWPVMMDPVQTDQILMALCANARDAIAGVGRVTIATRNLSAAAGPAGAAGTRSGDCVRLTLTDNGRGMTPEILEHVFEPFFTTKDVGEGTGMGLATVYGIVQQHGGTISVSSAPGEGTTVTLLLPRATAVARKAAIVEKPASRPGAKETVLLVEDEKSLRVTCCRFLEISGYTVLTAADPTAALALAAQHPGEIDVLLTDVVMPTMNGPELARQLQAQRPGLRCLFMSGYTADAIIDRGGPGGDVHFLQKPFSRDDLTRKVREVLDVGSGTAS